MPDQRHVASIHICRSDGRVTGTISQGKLGEVMIAIRGGSEAFHAYAVDGDDEIPRGSRIVVVEYYPPRTVVVSRL